MMKQINYNDIKTEMNVNGKIIAAEYSIGKDSTQQKARGFVQEVKSKRKVRTLHGDVNADFYYSFDNAREAQEFINAV